MRINIRSEGYRQVRCRCVMSVIRIDGPRKFRAWRVNEVILPNKDQPMELPKLVLLSGPICSGKSTLAKRLADKFAFERRKTTQFVQARSRGEAKDRLALQQYGQKLDSEFGGMWLVEDVKRTIEDIKLDVILDSVRTIDQVDALREAFGRKVVHVHLDAPQEVLAVRYSVKFSGNKLEPNSYDETQQNETEKNVRVLDSISDISINTDRCNEDDVFERVASLLGLYGSPHVRVVDVLIGGQFGSEGKGDVAAYLAPEYDYLVRVGGPNAGHRVRTDHAGKAVTFRQLPSGTRSCDAKLVIGPGAVIDIDILDKEIREHDISAERLFIDPQAMLISNEDKVNEAGLKDDIASTASGAGWAAARRIMYRGKDEVKLARDHEQLKPFLRPSLDVFDDAYREGAKIFLEGTQGTGLSIYHGYYPNVTSRDTTVSGCLAEAGISSVRVRKVIMVCRTYPIRVSDSDAGNSSGKMSKEVTREEIYERSGVPLDQLEELSSVTRRPRRISEFDWHLLRKSVALNAPTDIALTFADYVDYENQKARKFEQLTERTIRFVEEVERFTKAPVSLISTRFHLRSVIDRRSW